MEDPAERTIPPPDPASAAHADTEALVRSARSSIAFLTLRLRTVLHEAAMVEEAARSHAGEVDSTAAGLVARRQAEMAEDLLRARAEAAARVKQAEADAAAIVGRAWEELQRATRPAPPPISAPSLPPPSPALLTPPPYPPEHELFRPPVASVAPPTAIPAGFPTPPVARARPLPTVQGTPPPPPRPAASASPATTSRPAIPPDLTRGVDQVGDTSLAIPFTVPVASGVAGPSVARPRSWRDRFLHLDIILPTVAVLILVVVLLAWLA